MKVPKPVALTCSISNDAIHILNANKQRSQEASSSREVSATGKAPMRPRRGASLATSADEEEEESAPITFDQRVLALADEAQRKSDAQLSLAAPLSPEKHKSPSRERETRVQVDPHQMLWAEVESDDEALPEGDWEFRLKQLDKHEQQRRQRRASLPPPVEGTRSVTFAERGDNSGASAADTGVRIVSQV